MLGSTTKKQQLTSIEVLEDRRMISGTEFVHPGILNTQGDFTRMATKVAAGTEPWLSGWNKLLSNGWAHLGMQPGPKATITRSGALNDTYTMWSQIDQTFNSAMIWKVTGDTRYADQAVSFLNAWASTNTLVTGDSNAALAWGLYGFQWANAAEIMRTYSGWAAADQTQFKNYLQNVFLPGNENFLGLDGGSHWSDPTHYWANWDLANIGSMMAIGVFTDRHDLYDSALNYLYNGVGNGALDKAIYYMHPGNLGQGQEEGRDQGHSNLDYALLGQICQMAWNQGDDVFSYKNNEILAGVEYLAKYNLGNGVPYVSYASQTSGPWGTPQTVVSDGSRGQLRPIFELFYNHYVTMEGLSAPYTTQALAKTRPEGDNGNGDEYSWGTLLFAQDPNPTVYAPRNLVGYTKVGNIQLSWWGGANDTSFNLYRANSAAGPFTRIASGLPPTSTSYTDQNLPPGTYYYKVTGVNGGTETAATNVVHVGNSVAPFAQWKFDESGSTTASDATGNGITGTLNGGAGFVAGKTGNAVSLNGSTGYVSLPSGALSGVSDFTIASWVYLNAGQTWARIFDFGDGRGDWMFLTPKSGTGTLQFATGTAGNFNKQEIDAPALPMNQWVHVAVTFSDRLATLFVNGVAVGSNANMDFEPYEINGGMPNEWLGRSQYPGDPYLNGKLDDFRIYSGAMTTAQVYTLATGQAAPAVPGPPTLLSATAAVGNTNNLNWSAVSGATGYSIYRATASGGPYVPLATLVTGTTYADTGLTAGATYYYVVAASNGGGDGAFSPQASATALPPMPDAPTGLAAIPTSSSSISLTWTAAANDVAYNIKRSTVGGGPYTAVATGITGTTFTDTGRADGTTYYYVVSATNAAGESANSSEASATPSDLLVRLKFDETTAGTTAADSSGNNFNATLVGGPQPAAGVVGGEAISLSGTSQYATLPTGIVNGLTSFTVATWVNLNAVSGWARIFDFGTGTNVYMFLTPKNNSNGKVRFAISTAAGGGEQRIDGAAALPVGSWTHVAVTWANGVGTLYVNGTQVGQNTGMTLNPSSLGNTTQNYIGKSQYNDPYLNGRVDDFRIYNRALSASEVSTLAVTTAVPATPAGLMATAGDGQVALNWSAATGAIAYSVLRSPTSGGPYTTVASGVAGTSWADTSVANQSTYYYVVRASNVVGDSGNSNEASAMPNAAPTVVSAALADANPVTGTTAALNALGADDGDEANLTYTWSVTGTPPAAVAFSTNGSNSAKQTIATFAKAGVYNLLVTVTDAGGLSISSSVVVTVDQTLRRIAIQPSNNPSVVSGATLQFAANGSDQFGNAMAVSPTWSSTGGSVSSSGLYTAGAGAGVFTVTATSGAVNGMVSVTVASSSLFAGQIDLGNAANLPGSYSVTSGVYSAKGAGSDIWNTSDNFHFIYVPFSGDGQIIARVTSVQNTNGWAKSGIMFRESLATNARNAFIAVTPGQGVTFQRRTSTGGSSSNTQKTGISAPQWLKLVRSGNVFQAFYSSNGTSWSQLGSNQTISMAGSIFVGLAITSHNSASLCASNIDNVSIRSFSNLASTKTATASSVAKGSSAANAVDSSLTTAWNSAAGRGQWLGVDFGNTRSLSRIRLSWASNYARSYGIQVSNNNTTWTSIFNTSNGSGGIVDVSGLTASARYVRVVLNSGVGANYGLCDLSVFGQ